MQTCDVTGKYCVPAAIDPHIPGAKLDHAMYRPGLTLKGFARALEAVSHIGTFGANKYIDNGWIDVPNGEQRYTDALWRHLLADAQGERNDPESGLPHLHHALWNLMAIVDLQCRNAPSRAERAIDNIASQRRNELTKSTTNIDMNAETFAE